MLLHAPFPVLCSLAAATSCLEGCEDTANKRAEPSPGTLSHAPHLCWHGRFAKLNREMAPVLPALLGKKKPGEETLEQGEKGK